MADAVDSKSTASNGVPVQVRGPVFKKPRVLLSKTRGFLCVSLAWTYSKSSDHEHRWKYWLTLQRGRKIIYWKRGQIVLNLDTVVTKWPNSFATCFTRKAYVLCCCRKCFTQRHKHADADHPWFQGSLCLSVFVRDKITTFMLQSLNLNRKRGIFIPFSV